MRKLPAQSLRIRTFGNSHWHFCFTPFGKHRYQPGSDRQPALLGQQHQPWNSTQPHQCSSKLICVITSHFGSVGGLCSSSGSPYSSVKPLHSTASTAASRTIGGPAGAYTPSSTSHTRSSSPGWLALCLCTSASTGKPASAPFSTANSVLSSLTPLLYLGTHLM